MNKYVPLAFGVVILLAFSAQISAAEQPWLNLLRPESLAGWDHADTNGWGRQDEVLRGDGNASTLLSGWTLGDFDIEITFTDAGHAALELGLTAVSTGEAVWVPVGDVDRLMIRRRGEELNVGDQTQKLPADERYVLRLKPVGEVAITNIRLREPLGESIFNGRDLTGWWTPGNQDAWQVEEERIIKRGGGGNYLRSDEQYGNFVVSLEYRMTTSNNSGIGLRTPKGGWPSGDGMELQLSTAQGVNQSSNMSLYRNIPPLARADKAREWNHTVVKADGYMITAWVNGELVQHANTFRHPELKHRHLMGWIGFQDHGGIVEFRNLHLLEAPAGTGLITWTQPAKPRGVELVLDRLMNPERLSVADGVRSGAILAQTSGERKVGEQVVAELTGPGAITRVVQSGQPGKLKFFFDGEAEPRIESAANQLPGKLPRLGAENWPLLTCVPYEKSLKIVAEGDGDGDLQIEFVTFPGGVSVESFVDTQTSIPRGWMATLDYRHSHYKYGQHREHDRLPRADASAKKIEPGSAVPLVSLEGAGVVQWMKLRTTGRMLNDDHLWIEIQIDGESRPAIFAPARFLFAAIHEGQNYHNFVMTHAGGSFSRLAMPYGFGMTITAHNRGDQPISDIGVTVSYDPADDEKHITEIQGRMRLRGVFRDAGKDAGVDSLQLIGRGRLVGLVFEAWPKQPFGMKVVSPNDGWGQMNETMLLGTGADVAETKRCLSGRGGELAWRYFFLSPIDYDERLSLQFDGAGARRVLTLVYQAQP